jgi:hypothetical protein
MFPATMGGGIVDDIVLAGIGSDRLETSMERRRWRRGIGLGPRTIVPYLAAKIVIFQKLRDALGS